MVNINLEHCISNLTKVHTGTVSQTKTYVANITDMEQYDYLICFECSHRNLSENVLVTHCGIVVELLFFYM